MVIGLVVSFVTGTLLAGPIGTGNLYLTKVEANGVPLPLPLTFCVSSDEGSGSRTGAGCGALLGNDTGNTPCRDSLSSGGVSKRLVKRTGVGI